MSRLSTFNGQEVPARELRAQAPRSKRRENPQAEPDLAASGKVRFSDPLSVFFSGDRKRP
jgi:hypothetical protein